MDVGGALLQFTGFSCLGVFWLFCLFQCVVISRDDQGRATVRAIRIDAPIQLDGSLNESIYFGDGGARRRTEQIIVSSSTAAGIRVLKWAFQRVTPPT